MVSNIVIVGINRVQSRQVAEIIAEQLGMHFLDTIELFEFDNIPRNLTDILREQGEAYFRKKEKSLSGYASEFENTVIHVESGCILEGVNIKKLKQNAVIVYLSSASSRLKNELANAEYENELLKKFYNISLTKINQRVNLWKENANIVVKTGKVSALKVAADVIRAIESYYLK